MLEMARNGYKELEWLEIAENGWTWFEIGWPCYSFKDLGRKIGSLGNFQLGLAQPGLLV